MDSGWTVNRAGFNINHKYGFGAIDTNALLNAAASHNPITGEQKVAAIASFNPNASIPDNNPAGVEVDLVVGATGISNIEFVELEFGSNHTYFADLTIELRSPGGSPTTSILAQRHICVSAVSFPTRQCFQDYLSAGISFFTGGPFYRFGSARHLGENPTGTWKLRVIDGESGDSGVINHLRLRFYGR